MLIIVKLVLALVVVAIAAQQGVMYYNIVVLGSYMSKAPVHLQIITGAAWPILVVAVAIWLLWAIAKFKPTSLD